MRVLHIITGLNTGGAEMMLASLLEHMDRSQYKSFVISLSQEGPVSDKITKLGIPVVSLGMRGMWDMPYRFPALFSLLKKIQPSLIHTWMYHADMIGGIAARLSGNFPVLWSIHHADPRCNKFKTRIIAMACSYLSHVLPQKIAVCSPHGQSSHIAFGYCAEKMVCIPNGIDCSKFSPNAAVRRNVRKELNLSDDDVVVGHIGRWHEIKDHKTLICAIGLLRRKLKNVKLVLAGKGLTVENPHLVKWIDEAHVRDGAILLGERRDIARILNCFDVFALSSREESFPIAVVEALATAIPCVSTDVGIMHSLIGDCGRIVPRSDPEAFSEALYEMLLTGKESLKCIGMNGRQRVLDNFSIERIVVQYEDLYEQCVADPNL